MFVISYGVRLSFHLIGLGCTKISKVVSSNEQIIAAARDVQEKTEIYAPYNILPLDSAGASQSIMQLEEVRLLPLIKGHRVSLSNSNLILFPSVSFRLRLPWVPCGILVA